MAISEKSKYLLAGVAVTSVIGATATGVAVVSAGANPADTATSTQAACPKYFVYVLRGSGEDGPLAMPVPGTEPTENQGMGSTGKAFVEALKTAVSPETVQAQASSYQAVSIPTDPLRYVASLNDGQQHLIDDLRSFRSHCDATHSRVVVVGYSQGAQVIHGKLADGRNAVQEALEKNSVSDVVLFGDPMFCPASPGEPELAVAGSRNFSGDYDKVAKGVALCAVPLETKPGRTVWSYCHGLDDVCQGGGTISAIPQPSWLDGHHESYVNLDGDAAGWRVAAKYRAAEGRSLNDPSAYVNCTPGEATIELFERNTDLVSVMAENATPITATTLREVAGPQNGQRISVKIPAGAEKISVYSKARDSVPYRRLATISVDGQGCSPRAQVPAVVPAPVGTPPETTMPPQPGDVQPPTHPGQQPSPPIGARPEPADPAPVPTPEQATTSPSQASPCPNGMIGAGPDAQGHSGCYVPNAQQSTAPAPPPAPHAPTRLSASALNATTIQLTWAEADDPSSFEINNGDSSRSAPGSSRSFDWTGLAPGTYMCFKIRATSSAGASAWTPGTSPYYVCTTTPKPVAPPPPAGGSQPPPAGASPPSFACIVGPGGNCSTGGSGSNSQPAPAPKAPAPAPSTPPFASLDVSSGPPGTAIHATGGGFTPNSPITVTESGPEGSRTVGTITADAQGDFTMNLKVSSPTLPGRDTITFTQGRKSVSAHFTITKG